MAPPKRGTPDFLLLFLTFALVAFGFLMVFSASSMASVYQNGDPLYFTKRQGIFILIGMIGMFFFMNLPYTKLRKWVVPMFGGILLLLLLVLVIGTGPNGIHSWFKLGPFSLQPAEFAKLVIILYLASLIAKKGERMTSFKHGLLPALVIVAIVAGLIMLQPDLGTCIVLVAASAVVILVGGARLPHLAVLAASAVGLLVLAVSMPGASYRLARFTTFMDPLSDTQNTGYQLARSLYAFGHGGVTGAGFGQSILKLQYLPEAHNDFIFAIIGEEFGLIGCALFILVYSVFVWRGIQIALRCQDSFGMLTGIGIIGMFGIQAMVNIGGVTASIPMTGVTLPFISYGGSSILVCLISIGILLGISREQNLSAPSETKKRA